MFDEIRKITVSEGISNALAGASGLEAHRNAIEQIADKVYRSVGRGRRIDRRTSATRPSSADESQCGAQGAYRRAAAGRSLEGPKKTSQATNESPKSIVERWKEDTAPIAGTGNACSTLMAPSARRAPQAKGKTL